MKGKLILLTILFLLFAGFVAVKYLVLDKQETYGQLKVSSSPKTNVFLGNVLIGKTPFDNKIKVGEYQLKLIPDSEASSSASWQGKINIYKNSKTYVNRELGDSDVTSAGEIFTIKKIEKGSVKGDTGEIQVDTEPIGAIVYLDNDEKGIAPLLLSEVSPGNHELTISMPGFFPRVQKVNVERGMRSETVFKLAIDPSKKIDKKEKKDNKQATESATAKVKKEQTGVFIKIKQTPTGWLRVREEPSINASEEAKVNPGDTFKLIEEQSNWYKIEYEKGKDGWVASEFSEKFEE